MTNCIPLKRCVPSTVTVPAVPWKTAKLSRQGKLSVPSTLVQLPVPLAQVPLPPLIEPSATPWPPSQNCTVAPGTLTSRLI
ncbi:hypothetical protein D3C76_1397450 [compost metagenome]